MGGLVVIPARYGSTRFPGKPLAVLHGKPMIQHVYEQATKASRADAVVVATDDARIADAVERFDGVAVMTSPAARSGTERVAEAARGRDAQVIINVQGDEPLIHAEMVDQLAEYLERHRATPMASLMTRLRRDQDADNPNVVKVVVDRDGFALYFSRAPIPYMRDAQGSGLRAQGIAECGLRNADFPIQNPKSKIQNPTSPAAWYKHLGIYGYQRHFLLEFPHLEPTPLEQAEQLEQLRALEHGYRIKLLETAHDTVGVDTPEDLKTVDAMLQKAGGSKQQAASSKQKAG
ncbi:MAG: 3-deoxy-manno-octulosonate cytidylyltransferase [Candidatus Omnitrophica bacterium]|nr:3-deoxy-manno-octulosonate cytidylyltransferase [Candidatus Omnitrophota bacterium]